jgi:hypothetical protein
VGGPYTGCYFAIMISCSFRSQENNLFQVPLVFSNTLQFEGDENIAEYELWQSLSKRIHFDYLTSSSEKALMNSISETVAQPGEFAKPMMSFSKFISGISSLDGKKNLDSPILLPSDKVYPGEMLFLFRKPIDEPTRLNYKKYYDSIVHLHGRNKEPVVQAIRNAIDRRIPPLLADPICQQYHREIRSFCLEEAVRWFSQNQYIVHPCHYREPVAIGDVQQGAAVRSKTGIPINFNRKISNINL